MSDYFDFLRQVYFFKDLSDDDVSFVAGYGTTEVHDKDTILFNEKDSAEKFYVVLHGSVCIWKNYGEENPVMLTVQGRGHIFGEMALVDDLDRSATVITHEASEFIVFNHRDFEVMMHERSSVMFSILRSLSRMVRESSDVYIQSLNLHNEQLQKAYQELKETQAELIRAERFSSIGKFASFILHDLRNPIAMIRGYGEMLILESATDSSIAGYAKKVVFEADHVNQFANELLDFSRGEIRLNYALLSLDSFFVKLEQYLRDAFARRGISLETEIACSRKVMLDEERLLRAVINIADNSRKASSRGGIVSIKAEEHQDQLRISVADKGEGMSEEVLSKIFEPFYSSSKSGGTGLGMLVVKHVVEAHQGTIDVWSEPGRGTIVSLTLPFVP